MPKAKSPPPPRLIDIHKCVRTRKSLVIEWSKGDSRFSLDENDNPLPSFVDAFEAVAQMVPSIVGAPAIFGEAGLRVIGFEIGELGGAQTVSFDCRKERAQGTIKFEEEEGDGTSSESVVEDTAPLAFPGSGGESEEMQPKKRGRRGKK